MANSTHRNLTTAVKHNHRKGILLNLNRDSNLAVLDHPKSGSYVSWFTHEFLAILFA